MPNYSRSPRQDDPQLQWLEDSIDALLVAGYQLLRLCLTGIWSWGEAVFRFVCQRR